MLLLPSPAALGAPATATLQRGRQWTTVRLKVDGLPPTERGELYEVWFVREQGRVSAGTFGMGQDGRADVRLTTVARARDYPRVGVTREPDGTNPGRDGPTVLAGVIGE